MFKTILVATDGSEHAYKAVTTAANLACKYDAKLIILHVLMHGKVPEGFRRMAEVEHLMERVQPQVTEVENIPSSLAASLHNMEPDISEHRFYDFLGENIIADNRRVATENGVTDIETKIAEGDAASKIVQLATDNHVDLIVMGSRGLGEIKGMLMGSVSHKVSQLTQCPCLTVK